MQLVRNLDHLQPVLDTTRRTPPSEKSRAGLYFNKDVLDVHNEEQLALPTVPHRIVLRAQLALPSAPSKRGVRNENQLVLPSVPPKLRLQNLQYRAKKHQRKPKKKYPVYPAWYESKNLNDVIERIAKEKETKDDKNQEKTLKPLSDEPPPSHSPPISAAVDFAHVAKSPKGSPDKRGMLQQQVGHAVNMNVAGGEKRKKKRVVGPKVPTVAELNEQHRQRKLAEAERKRTEAKNREAMNPKSVRKRASPKELRKPQIQAEELGNLSASVLEEHTSSKELRKLQIQAEELGIRLPDPDPDPALSHMVNQYCSSYESLMLEISQAEGASPDPDPDPDPVLEDRHYQSEKITGSARGTVEVLEQRNLAADPLEVLPEPRSSLSLEQLSAPRSSLSLEVLPAPRSSLSLEAPRLAPEERREGTEEVQTREERMKRDQLMQAMKVLVAWRYLTHWQKIVKPYREAILHSKAIKQGKGSAEQQLQTSFDEPDSTPPKSLSIFKKRKATTPCPKLATDNSEPEQKNAVSASSTAAVDERQQATDNSEPAQKNAVSETSTAAADERQQPKFDKFHGSKFDLLYPSHCASTNMDDEDKSEDDTSECRDRTKLKKRLQDEKQLIMRNRMQLRMKNRKRMKNGLAPRIALDQGEVDAVEDASDLQKVTEGERAVQESLIKMLEPAPESVPMPVFYAAKRALRLPPISWKAPASVAEMAARTPSLRTRVWDSRKGWIGS